MLSNNSNNVDNCNDNSNNAIVLNNRYNSNDKSNNFI